ncbi:MAG: alpha/beta hydrolase [Acidobacteriota bacterium]|nr:MAG: alpha/beta hydrolase [Acidobacteriota bacterium]
MSIFKAKPHGSLHPILLLLLTAMALTGFWGISCQPGQKECLPVQVTHPAGNYIIPGTQGAIPYRTIDGQVLHLDAFIQPGAEIRPAVVVIHGGGFTAGSRVAFVGQFLELLTKARVNWFSIDYRLAPAAPYPAAVSDLESAIEFIRCNAREFQVDPSQIILLGEDSGALMALQAAARHPKTVRSVISIGGLYDLESHPQLGDPQKLETILGLSDTAGQQQALREMSPLASITGPQPETLIIHGSDDQEVPLDQAATYCQRIIDEGGNCELVTVEGGIHRPENWHPAQWGYKNALVAFLNRQLGPLPSIPESVSSPTETRLQKDIVFASHENPAGSGLELRLDAYLPASEEPLPAVILAHGGGWEAGDKVTYLTPLFEPLSEAGFAWFSIDYRLEPEYRNWHQLDDLRRAIRFVRANAKRFNVDPDRIAILGESASGQMVAQVAALPCPAQPDSRDPVDRESCEVQGAVSFYGVYDFQPLVRDVSEGSRGRDLFGLTSLDQPALDLLREYSPLFRVHRDMPPLLLIHGNNEFLWQQAEALSKKLDEIGTRYRLIELDGAPHGMENWEGHPEWRHYKAELIDWLKQTLH